LEGAIRKARSCDDDIEDRRIRVGDREVARGAEIARKDRGDLNIQATINKPGVGRDKILNANPALLHTSAILVVVGRNLGDSVALTLSSVVVALDSEDGVLASDKPCTKKASVGILKQMGVEVGVLELGGEQSALRQTAGAVRQLKKRGLVESHHARHGEARDRLLHVEEKPTLGVIRGVTNIVQGATAWLQPKGGSITNVGECGRAEDANTGKIR
jgi:hypothetical protein